MITDNNMKKCKMSEKIIKYVKLNVIHFLAIKYYNGYYLNYISKFVIIVIMIINHLKYMCVCIICK